MSVRKQFVDMWRKSIKSQSLYGCVIQGKKGSGLFLQIINHELFQRSLENTPQEDFVTQIIEYFVQEDEYIKSEIIM